MPPPEGFMFRRSTRLIAALALSSATSRPLGAAGRGTACADLTALAIAVTQFPG
jgi:hypothetical protein